MTGRSMRWYRQFAVNDLLSEPLANIKAWLTSLKLKFRIFGNTFTSTVLAFGCLYRR